MIPVYEDVDADAEPRRTHDNKQLREEDQLLACVLQKLPKKVTYDCLI